MSKTKLARSTPLLAALLLALALPLSAQEAAPRAENAFLSQEAAAARSARVSNVAYALDFTLTGEPTFKATSKIDFDLSDTLSPLTVDLDKATILRLTVNGREIRPQYNQWFITISGSDLKKGRNTVSVEFSRQHSTNGEGLHRYVDKSDGRVYLYSHFEPAAAHQMFASFDQPDLKATYQLTATAPKDWQVISTTRETKIDELGATRRWTFPATPKLSPYNFSMHAGPYKVWEDNSGKYPMRLFARQSLASQVYPQDWFRYTKQGLTYFDDYFGIPYPFKKYDQILVPQFIYGAMENAGAVTFTETRFTSTTPPTTVQRQRLASVILHEMAHQWFGDLVTMRWWNGLWLNESFASYMATLGTTKSDEFDQPWLSQYQSKQGAYRTDDSIATHPIEVPVATTQNAFDNIDAITYTKGASTLHQLRQMIGPETFRQGVHDYLVKYSYQNATLDDFIGSLSKASGKDLQPWAKQWLYEPGLNAISADFACEGGKISRFALKQSATVSAYPTLREQLVQVAVFGLDGGKLVLSEKLPVTYSGASTEVPALVGKACPALVYPNYEDWGFTKVVLDPVSFATARTQLSGIEDTMLRSMLWQSLNDGLRDRRLGLEDYIETVLANAPKERDYTLLRQAMTAIGIGKAYLGTFASGSDTQRRLQARIEETLWNGLQADRANRDRAKTWLSNYIELATSDAALQRLRGMLDGKVDAGIEIDQETRWSIIEQLNRYDTAGSLELIAKELAKDGSENGQLSALAATVIRPDAKAKAETLAKVQALDNSEPYSRLRVMMGSLYPAGQNALAEASAQQRLDTLAAIDAKADPVFMRTYAGQMIPAACTSESVARLERAIANAGPLSAGTKRSLLISHEEDVRCVAMRKFYDEGKSKR
ncbi:aminopeptidase N [Arenimonas sp.]|uniref:aminopeptidase N n=1 Tax=Arenimonas sp. TaxID=1872635 RepID=UPI0039E5780A